MFEGCFTAIVTPFKSSGIKPEVDYEAYSRLIEIQNSGRVAGIVACGTTGESPVLSHEEHNRVIEVTIEKAESKVIAGTGSNSTWEAIEMTKHAEDAGAHASLQVCPYYNKPSQEGLFRHFSAIAEAVEIPIILYNIPGRSALEISPETMARLSEEYSHIVGVKEATGKPEVWEKIRELCGSDFILLSGNDSDTYEMMKSYNAKGVVSVASNVIPGRMQKFVELGLNNNFEAMEKEHKALEDFFKVLFIDTNPVPVKEAMNLLGMPAGGFRLPLCETTAEKRERIKEMLEKLSLL